jgi:citrate lyase beta subunit
MQNGLRLGASLYVPATRADVAEIGNGVRYGELRSVIYCTEDAIAPGDVDGAIENLAAALPRLRPSSTLRFVRVRNPAVLERLLAECDVERIDGFVLPKIDRKTLSAYAELLSGRDRLWVMPTLETADVFDARKMARLRDRLEASPLRDRILALRIGGNDLLNLLGLRRSPGTDLYDTPLAGVISQLICTFRPAGFALTAPVFDRIDSPEDLAREVRRDVEFGLLGKSAIHPSQIAHIESEYAVTPEEFELACGILDPAAAPVFRLHGRMCEPATDRRWAQIIVERRHVFGFREAAATTRDSRVRVVYGEG